MTTAMIDSGASENFIDREYAQANQIPLQRKAVSRTVLTVDGSEVIGGPVTHNTLVDLDINNHYENIRLHCITIGNTPIILGLPWLKLHDPDIRWKNNQVSFTSDRCAKKCLALSPQATTVPEEKAAAQYFKDVPLDESINNLRTIDSHDKCSSFQTGELQGENPSTQPGNEDLYRDRHQRRGPERGPPHQ